MKKNVMTKIIASLAFLWIVLSILWTWLLIIFSEPQTQEFSAEQIAEIQKMMESQSWATSHSGEVIVPDFNISDEINITK
jgi:preprotein translocase subunit SecG